MKEITNFRVKKNTDVKLLSNAIVAAVRNKETVRISVVGMQALHVAIKAITIARGILLSGGIELAVSPCFETVYLPSGEERTAIVLMLVYAPLIIEKPE